MIPQGFRVTRLAAAVVTILSMAAPLAADIPGYTLKRRTDFSQEVHPRVVAAAPDGKVWFADERYTPHSVGFFTPADGKVTKFAIPCDGCDAGTKLAYVESITVGPDGNAWFLWTHVGSDGSPLNGGINSFVSKVTTAGAFTSYAIQTKDAFRRYIFGSISSSMIATGPDGNLWFTESSANGGQPPKVGKITTAGAITEYTVPTNFAAPSGITAGPDGNVWFTETDRAKIGRITPAGTITEFPLPSSVAPYDIVQAPDGKLWFTDRSGKLGRITTTGAVTMYDLDPKSGATQIAVGKDNNLYFTYTVTTDNAGNYEGRIGQVVLQNVPAGAGNIAPALSFEALFNKAVPFDLMATDGGLFATAGEPDASLGGQSVDYAYELHDDRAQADPPCGGAYEVRPPSGPLPPFTLNVFGSTRLQVFGPGGEYSATVTRTAGTVPDGISIGESVPGVVVVSGVPLRSGHFDFTVRYRVRTGEQFCSIDAAYSLDVARGPDVELVASMDPSFQSARVADNVCFLVMIASSNAERGVHLTGTMDPSYVPRSVEAEEVGAPPPAINCTRQGYNVDCSGTIDPGATIRIAICGEIDGTPGMKLPVTATLTATSYPSPEVTRTVALSGQAEVIRPRRVRPVPPNPPARLTGRP